MAEQEEGNSNISEESSLLLNDEDYFYLSKDSQPNHIPDYPIPDIPDESSILP